MSRIGKQPVRVPGGVTVSIDGNRITAEGPKGTLTFDHDPRVGVAWDESEQNINVTIDDPGHRPSKALWGTTRAIINNMVRGVSEGYRARLEIVGVGWGAQVQGQTLSVNVGFAAPRLLSIPGGVSVEVERQNVTVSGPDKQVVNQFAAEVRAIKKPEPYQGKGIKYVGEVVSRKAGKQFGS